MEHRRHDFAGRGILARAGSQHQLEQHALLELLDGVDHRPALVPSDRPGGEDPAGRQHVHAERSFPDPPLPHGLTSLLLVHECPSI